jgi:thiol-disulfide isomerase/thioredoxin
MLLELSVRALMTCLLGAVLVAGCDRQSEPAPQANATAPATAAAPKGPEPTGTLDISQRGKAAPTEAFVDPDGKRVTLAAFKGRPVLVNLWATWCAPCVREMPTLDKVAERAGAKLKVLTVSQDSESADLAPTFARGQFKHLERYRDTEQKLGFSYGTGVLPTTVLYDADGKEVWRVVGAMDWDGPRANTLLADYLG